MSTKSLKDPKALEREVVDLAAHLDEAIKEEFFGFLKKLRTEAARIDLKEKVALEAKRAAEVIIKELNPAESSGVSSDASGSTNADVPEVTDGGRS